MKYFTLHSWIRDQDLSSDDSSSSTAIQHYKTYLESVGNRLPADYVVMIRTVCIHDATMPALNIDVLNRRIIVTLDAGDSTMRERRKINLHYEEVIEVSSTSDPDKGLPGPHGFGQLGNDEIEVLEDGVYEHRLLFSSGIELSVRFKSFRLEIL